jgi:uncharacterized spore protein YtfJ
MVQLSHEEQLTQDPRTREILESVAELSRNAGIADAVFGAPVDREGVTVIPVARLARGGGGGSGTEAGAGTGGGGGFGVTARPVGAFVIRGGKVSWRPALDLNRVIAGGQVVAVVALLMVRSIVRARRRRRKSARNA